MASHLRFKSLLLLFVALSPFAQAEEVQFTLFHTNDIHSHFRAEKDARRLGGTARLKTLIDRERSQTSASLLLDGGDFSEGSIYHLHNFGEDALRMMGHLGYDAVVLGNHDWLNGPEVLWNVLASASRPSAELAMAPPIISANISRDRIPTAVSGLLPPYLIKTLELPNGGTWRIGIVGLSTYQFIYDEYFKPVKIESPIDALQRVLPLLRDQTDWIILLSHNGVQQDRALLQRFPEIAGAISAHDHQRLAQPERVTRDGAPDAFIVEAGCWGRELGKLRLTVERATKALRWNYELLPVNEEIAENPATAQWIRRIEGQLERRLGQVFSQEVARTSFSIDHADTESLAANVVADSIRAGTGADLALEYSAFIYGKLDEGVITSADVLHMMPGIFQTDTGQAWTTHLVPMTGRNLRGIFTALFAHRQLLKSLGILGASGIEVEYEPRWSSSAEQDVSVIHQIRVQGLPLENTRVYRLAVSGGMLRTLQWISQLFPGLVPVQQAQNTGLESWRLVVRYLSGKRNSAGEISPAQLTQGDRFRIRGADLVSYRREVQFTRSREGTLEVRGSLRNVGTLPWIASDETQPGTLAVTATLPSGAVVIRRIEIPRILRSNEVWEWTVSFPVERDLMAPTLVALELQNVADALQWNNRWNVWTR